MDTTLTAVSGGNIGLGDRKKIIVHSPHILLTLDVQAEHTAHFSKHYIIDLFVTIFSVSQYKADIICCTYKVLVDEFTNEHIAGDDIKSFARVGAVITV